MNQENEANASKYNSNDDMEAESPTPFSTIMERYVDTYLHLEDLKFNQFTSSLLILTSCKTGDYWGGNVMLANPPQFKINNSQNIDSLNLRKLVGVQKVRGWAGNTSGAWLSATHFVIGTEKGTVEVWHNPNIEKSVDTKFKESWCFISPETISVLYHHGHIVSGVATWCEVDDLAVSVGYDEIACLWNLSTHTLVKNYNAHADVINCVECQPGNVDVFVTGASDRSGALRIWDKREAKSIGTFKSLFKRYWGVHSLTWNLNNVNLIGAGCESGHVLLLDMRKLETEDLLLANNTHTSKVSCISFCTANSSWIASGSHDRLVAVYDINTNQQIALDGRHNDMITALSWYPDSSMLVSGSFTTQIHANNIKLD